MIQKFFLILIFQSKSVILYPRIFFQGKIARRYNVFVLIIRPTHRNKFFMHRRTRVPSYISYPFISQAYNIQNPINIGHTRIYIVLISY